MQKGTRKISVGFNQGGGGGSRGTTARVGRGRMAGFRDRRGHDCGEGESVAALVGSPGKDKFMSAHLSPTGGK